MTKFTPVIVDALRQPETLVSLGLSDWDVLLRQARRTGLLSRLAVQAGDLRIDDQLPPQVLPHLRGARAVAAEHQRSVRWEVNRIERALSEANGPVVLLKGAAYVMANLPPARGRLCSDIDLLVPKDRLGVVEEALRRHGWEPAPLSKYHDHYFRNWMHELPPMRHRDRGTIVDVHHTILPLTDTLRLDPSRLFEDANRLSGSSLHVLGPIDMVLHGGSHLFRNGEFRFALRDLADMDALIRHFGGAPAFWHQFVARAETLNLRTPAFFSLRYAQRFLATPIPEEVQQAIRSWRSARAMVAAMDVLVERALVPRTVDRPDAGRALARWLLAHYPIPRVLAVISPTFWLKRVVK
jgi:hypothetical protein